MKDKSGSGQKPIVIKKYANRRLYNTASSSYVTLDHLAGMVREGADFVVQDAKSGEDITRSVLAQIIFEQESSGQNLLPIRFLRQLIRFYGDSLQTFLPSYLETSLETFAKNQESLRARMNDAFQGKTGLKDFEEMARNNIAMFERALRMFSPFGAKGEESPRGNGGGARAEAKAEADEISNLKSQIEAMRRQLEALASRK